MSDSAQLIPGGVIPPLVTPMRPDSSPDIDSLSNLIDHVLANGASGILVLGSTGENGLLSHEERIAVAKHAISHVAGRAHVMVGIPAMGLLDATTDAAIYADLGASSLLVPAPYGFVLVSSELERYFRTVAAVAPSTPIVAYNVPSRVGVTLDAALVANLAGDGTIAALKDSSGDLEGHRIVSERTRGVTGFRRLTGSELCIDAALLGGFHGAVPGLANVFIEQHVKLLAHSQAGDWEGASSVQRNLVDCADLYFAPSRPGSFVAAAIGALKEALVQRGLIDHATVSASLSQVDEQLRAHVASVLERVLEPTP